MAGSKSNYLENEILDHVLGGGDYTRPATVYIGLWTAALSDTSTGATANEANYGSYARVAVTNDGTSFPAAASGAKSNDIDIEFPQSTSGSNTVVAVAVLDAAANGNILYWADLAANRTITSGDTPIFLAGELDFTED